MQGKVIKLIGKLIGRKWILPDKKESFKNFEFGMRLLDGESIFL